MVREQIKKPSSGSDAKRAANGGCNQHQPTG